MSFFVFGSVRVGRENHLDSDAKSPFLVRDKRSFLCITSSKIIIEISYLIKARYAPKP